MRGLRCPFDVLGFVQPQGDVLSLALELQQCQSEVRTQDVLCLGLGILGNEYPEVPCGFRISGQVSQIPEQKKAHGLTCVPQVPGMLVGLLGIAQGIEQGAIPCMEESDVHVGVHDALLVSDLTVHGEPVLEGCQVTLPFPGVFLLGSLVGVILLASLLGVLLLASLPGVVLLASLHSVFLLGSLHSVILFRPGHFSVGIYALLGHGRVLIRE